MPEGDTIHKVAAAIAPLLEGKRISRIRIGRGPRRGVRTSDPNAFEKRLTGRMVESVYPEGKHLFFRLEEGELLRTHLGLHGSWHRYSLHEGWRKPTYQLSLALWVGEEVLVCFNAREVELLRERSLRHGDLERRIGPDLLAPEVDLAAIVVRARELLEPQTPLVDVLLDQQTAAGIGNVYKSELLFLARRLPLEQLAATDDRTLLRLFTLGRDLLARNLGGAPRTTRFTADGQGRLWVYGRAGAPCLRCRTPIRSALLGRGARSTYWCPKCQSGRSEADLELEPQDR